MTATEGWSEQDLRDAWARWTEARPDERDWKIQMELTVERAEVPLGATEFGVKLWEPVLRVDLLGAPRALYPDELRDGWAERGVLASWRLRPDDAVRVVDVLARAFAECGWGVASAAVGRGVALELWVWEQLRRGA